MRLKDRIEELATIENAQAYAAETDQFVFCLNLFKDEVSAWDDDADEVVEVLEDKFDELNGIT